MHLYEPLENPVGKTKEIPVYRQNFLKPSGKNKKKHHDIESPMLLDPLS
jgi:hypothetical protein